MNRYYDLLGEYNNNYRLAIQQLTSDEKREILREYHAQALPIRNRCQTVTDSEVLIIRTMCEAYNQLIEGNKHLTRVRPSACSLPAALARVGAFLAL